ncbi:5-methyltetrahydropteroyltriglutamate--homocysteine S-methyltransferase [Sphingomonas bacterium]|uniref:5-methyltetrahydropteroyltriglutamate-- homocysteine S-methyltransferase n=1 Tax=Sphingomonas bacterium TaxID=1895847 RepID=UPI00157668AE|nr:5-methyltetrahydropteroyltriglutamate--homocysteine S-methyltransferase [Sphingomonas bacterium]
MATATVAEATRGTAPLDPPFRADQVGSLLRPADLLEARAQWKAGTLPLDELRSMEDRAIRQVVVEQEATGLRVVTDGEFRRESYFADFFERGLGGFKRHADAGKGWNYQDAQGKQRGASLTTITAPMRWTKPIHADEFEFLASVTKVTPKITLPSPSIPHFFGGRENISRDVYPDLDMMWADLVDSYRRELKALYDVGCRYVQIDETAMAKFGDPKIRQALADRGDSWEDLLPLYAGVINDCLAEAPADMHIALHSCRGNNQGSWQAEGGYDPVADTLFNKVNAHSYFLEYDSPRAGDFSPLAHAPADKMIVLGLVTTKSGRMESRDDLLKRIGQAAVHLPLDQLCLSPQCGFASAAPGNPISFAEQDAKLRLVVDVAGEVWG